MVDNLQITLLTVGTVLDKSGYTVIHFIKILFNYSCQHVL